MVNTSGCDVCQKSSLSLLLLRPSPIAKDRLLAAAGSQNINAEPSAIAGLLPKPVPAQSRFALRLLRPGYVHVYIPAPPPGVKNWLVFRVSREGDMVPEGHAMFSQPDLPISCDRPGHIATGMKVISIPQAHKVSEIWIAFSANLWNDTLRAKNKADPAVMQKVLLQAGGPNTFVPSAAKLKAQVLECWLNRLSIANDTNHDYPFNSLAGHVEELAQGLSRAAAKHPKTAGKELAVVLRDPVGIVAELNALRLRRNELIKTEVAKPENVHALNSSNTILALRKSLVDEQDLDSYEQVSPLRTLEAFMKQEWPPGTEWQELTAADRKRLLTRAKGDSSIASWLLSPYRNVFEQKNLGRVFFPDSDARAAAWTQVQVEKHWSRYARYYDEEERANWVKTFHAGLETNHYKPLSLLEKDWVAALQDSQITNYFDRHFDPKCPIEPLRQPVDSIVYAQEHDKISVPAPFVDGPVVDRYAAMFDYPITDKRAHALRKAAGNKDEMLTLINTQLTGEPGKDGMRDKSFDLAKGLSELSSVRPIVEQHGWIGHALALFSINQLSAYGSAAMMIAARKGADSAAAKGMFVKLQNLLLVQRALECAVQGALKSNAPNKAVLITMRVNADDALAIYAARNGQSLGTSKARIKKAKATNAKIPLTLLTDTDSIKAADNLMKLAKDAGSGVVQMGTSATSAAVVQAAGTTVTMSEEKFLFLYRGQASAAAKAANLIRTAMPAMARTDTVADLRALAKTLDARLALASMMIQLIGIWYGRQAVSNAGTDSDMLDAKYGLLDSAFGFTGGAVALWAQAAEMDVARRAGTGALATDIKLNVLRVFGNLIGVAGGVINALASKKKSLDQAAVGNAIPSDLYMTAMVAFGGTAGTSGVLTAGAIAEALSARAIGGAAVQTVARYLCAAGVSSSVGGIGLILLGAGIVLQVSAIVLTPNELQRWLGRSYFGRDGGVVFSGKRDDMFRKGDWKAEADALDQVLAASAAAQQ